MKIAFKQRSWLENMGLVFTICGRMFVPLFVIRLLIGLPAFTLHHWSLVDSRSMSMDLWEWVGYRSGWALFLDILEIPVRQGFCIYLVARCYEGVRVGTRRGFIHVMSCLPSLTVLDFVSFIAICFAFFPGILVALFIGAALFNGFGEHPLNEWLLLASVTFMILCMAIPVLWMSMGLSLGPTTVLVEQRDPVLALEEGLSLASGHRRYILSFLGLLYVPAVLAVGIFGFHGGPDGDLISSVFAGFGEGSGLPMFLVVMEILKTVLYLPATIAPVILYYQFRAVSPRPDPANLAHLVDEVGLRHDHHRP